MKHTTSDAVVGPYTAALNDLRRWRDHVAFLITSLEVIERGGPALPTIAPAEPVAAQPAPKERRTYKKRKPVVVAVIPPSKASPVTNTEAQARRDLLLGAITKSEVGLTLAELRKAFPKMGEGDASNALQQLKQRGVIRRAGNAWVKVETAA